MIIQQWKTKPYFVFPYLLQKNGRCCLCKWKAGSSFRQLLLWGWENLKVDLCRNLAGSSCRGSEASAGKSHLQETAEVNAYADVKPSVPVSELELRNWWNLREQNHSLLEPSNLRNIILPVLWFGLKVLVMLNVDILRIACILTVK